MSSCPGAFRGEVAAKTPDHLPYVQMAGTDLYSYKLAIGISYVSTGFAKTSVTASEMPDGGP